MNHHTDPVDRALESLRSQSWTGASFDETLEHKLMQTFPRQQRPSFVRRHAALCVTLAALFAGGVGFAATGGTQVVKAWIVKLELIGADGQVIEAHLQPAEGANVTSLSVAEGEATATIDLQAGAFTIDPDEGQTARVVLEVQTTTDSGSEEAGVAFTGNAAADIKVAPLGQSDSVLAEIGEAVDILEWVDESDEWQELHVVPLYGEELGFDVFTTFYGEGDETLYRRVGSVRGVDPDTTQVGELVWPEAGLAIIPFIKADGSDLSLAVDLTGRRADGDTTLLQFRGDDGQDRFFRLNRVDVQQADQSPKPTGHDRR